MVAGTPLDRIAGLEPLLSVAVGCSILDIGCHKGFVAYEFAKRGAARIDVIDRFAEGIDVARALLEEFDIQFSAQAADLTQRQLADLGALPAYDIVLYLGVHHHLTKQDRDAAESLFADARRRAARYFAVRTGARRLAAIHEPLSQDGFELWHQHAGNIGPLRIYRRPV